MVIGGARFDGSSAPDFELGCVAHSDGDVIYHGVVDAILGALTMPDIGQARARRTSAARTLTSTVSTSSSSMPNSKQSSWNSSSVKVRPSASKSGSRGIPTVGIAPGGRRRLASCLRCVCRARPQLTRASKTLGICLGQKKKIGGSLIPGLISLSQIERRTHHTSTFFSA